MKCTIEGKRYDTNKARLLAEASNHEPVTSPDWWRERLYRTPRSGAYFLAGEGNARSHYARRLGPGSWEPGERIDPLSEAEAFAWAQCSLPAEEVKRLFPDRMIETTTTIKRRVSTIHRKWSDNIRFIFAITKQDGGLFEVTTSSNIDDLWLEFARDLRSTPEDLRAKGWRIWPCTVEWKEKE